MRGNLITREEAIKRVGEETIVKLEKLNCEPTGRLGLRGYPDDWTEWTAAIQAIDQDGYEVGVIAYYYTSNEQDQIMADNDGDGSSISWEVEGYEVY